MVRTCKQDIRKARNAKCVSDGVHALLMCVDNKIRASVLSELTKSFLKLKMSTLKQAKLRIEAAIKAKKKTERSEANKRYYRKTKNVTTLKKIKKEEHRGLLANIFGTFF
jgi:hypothetical protein